MSRQRILLWGWFGLKNMGDDLLLETTLKHLHGEITVAMKKPYKLKENANQIPRSYKQAYTQSHS